MSEPKQSLEEMIAVAKVADALPGMGYWATGDPLEVLGRVAPMSDEEVAVLAAYMDAATTGIAWMGFASCHLCGKRLGTRCMVTPDGKWRFPEKWDHYITEHGVRPLEAFIQDALKWRQS